MVSVMEKTIKVKDFIDNNDVMTVTSVKRSSGLSYDTVKKYLDNFVKLGILEHNKELCIYKKIEVSKND